MSIKSPSHDITQGRLLHNIAHLAWPLVLSQLLFMTPGLYDAYWLGTIGAGAQAAAGLATSVRVTMISVLMALSGASGAVVARYVGAKDEDNANLATLQGVILMILASGTLGLIGFVFAEPLMRLAGADADVLPLAVRYARILFAGLIAMEMVPSVGGMMSAAGAPQVRLSMMAWTTGVMLLVEPFLVKWLGLEGAVLSLVGAHVVGMLWGLGVLFVGRASVRIDMHNLRLDFPMMWRIIRITLPAILKRGAQNFAMSVLMRLIAGYGAITLAAWVIVTRIFGFVQVPGFSLSGVASAMIGQNLGAKKPERAERATVRIVWITALVTVCLLAGVLAFAPAIMGWFSDDAQSITLGAWMLRFLAVGYLANILALVWDNAQFGAGDSVAPMFINLVALWGVQIPLAYVLSRWAHLEANGIWLSLIIGWTIQAGLMAWRFRQGKWKLRQI